MKNRKTPTTMMMESTVITRSRQATIAKKMMMRKRTMIM
jgi:hypothetical protein